MHRPSVSFLVTNLNGAHALARTLPRLAEVIGPQTFRDDCELVAVDAGSTDGSLEVLREFGRTFGNVTLHSEPCSRGRGRQLAFVHSRGRHLAIVDSDTFVRPYYGTFLQGYLAAYERDPSAVLAYEEMDQVRANMTCTVYPRELIDRVGGWRDLWVAEDIDLWVRLVREGRLRFLPACVADDLDHVVAPVAPTSESYRTMRERRYATGLAFYRRWVRNAYSQYVSYAYSLPEKLRFEWARQPRWSNRVLDLVGSTIARIRFYLGHPPVVRLDPARHNGYALFHYLLEHIVRPSEFGLDDGIMELRANRIVREYVASGSLSSAALAIYHELSQRGRVVHSED